ncbi:hypothetical protein R1sor_000496 [Riccia sorocarpa]|uniref:Uncharacterized protein n=1 Tax=Riccia sorocarpa TaxID=122646 RepID=A0ABD3GZ99_9MARC
MATLPLGGLSVRYCCRASLPSPSTTSSDVEVQSSNARLVSALSGRSVDRNVTISGAAGADLMATKSSDEQSEFCFAKTCAKLGLIGLAAAAICYSAPALAYKGGGPYGMEVTRGQDLTGRDFSGKKLIKQDFKTSILRQCNFRNATLLGASFFDSDLTGADLTDADLRGADFSLANASKANFTNANFEGATVTGNTSFKGAVITGADFTDVLWRDDQRAYLCKIADGVNTVTGNATRDTLLCE